MFLHLLRYDEQKVFMQLASLAMKADLNVARAEAELFAVYEREMGRTFGDILGAEHNLDEVLASTVDMNTTTRKLLFFELLGMVVSDDCVAPQEQGLIDRVRVEFGLSLEVEKAMLQSISRLMALYNEIGALIS